MKDINIDEKKKDSKVIFVSPFASYNLPDKDRDFAVDLSNPFAEVFEEVPPYAIDPATGKFLNDSSVPKIISKGKINIQEKIDSFGKEVDIYSILEKFAYSDDISLINARPCQYGDISNFPDNLNDYAAFVDAHYKNLTELNPDLAKKVLDSNISAEAIESEANQILQNRITEFNKNNEKKGENE